LDPDRSAVLGGTVPFTLNLPEPWRSRGWKVKIRDRERLESPHVTILNRARAWRFNLRSETFLDKEPDQKEVPKEVVDAIRANLVVLREAWDRIFPENPISSEAER
jgi:hypothetical protein